MITAAYFKIFLFARNQERRIASLMVYCEDNLQEPSLWKQSLRQILVNRESKAVKTIGKIQGQSDSFMILLKLSYIPKTEALLRSENPFAKKVSF